ncbi:TIGR03086 family metal-binding protein [Actinomadura scrupuli]|uniref:TIGR03086 family metal-binding protein n=1 Tax=Actinomadura scrupuli TaxID=559629 RepID=UPI003D9856B0
MTWELSGYHRALEAFEAVVEGVQPAGWAAPSPCAGWTAWDVAGHVTGGQRLIEALATGQIPPDPGADPGRFCGDDAVRSWRTARAECTSALTETALQRPVPFGALGRLPLHLFLGGHILELLVHTWDLAQATGQVARLDPDLVHHAFATAQVVAGTLRTDGRLGPPLTPPARSDELTRLLAFMGRAAGLRAAP